MADDDQGSTTPARRRFERRELTPEAREDLDRRRQVALDAASLRAAVRAAEESRRGGPRPEVLAAIDRHLENIEADSR